LRATLWRTFLVCLVPAGLAAAPPTPDVDNGGITLPAGFRALVVADELGPLRFLAVAPNGDIYARGRRDGIVALRDADGDGRAEVKQTFAVGSGAGTGIAVRDGWLYYSTLTGVYRYRLTPGELVPKGQPETIVSGLPADKQHDAKSFTFDDQGRLLVEVGSPSNAYGDPDRAKGSKGKDPTEFLKVHGGIWRFDAAKSNQAQADGFHFSTGHRHIIALAWNPVSKALFGVMHGRDQLNTVDPDHYTEDDNAELPAEEMHLLKEGSNLGWPFTYYDPLKKARMVAPEYGGDNNKRAEPGKYQDPLVAFPAHWAPLQMTFYRGEQFPAKYRGGAFVAFHGSWNRAPRPQKGYNVTFVPFDEKGMPRGGYEVFAEGFPGVAEFTAPREAKYRPGGVAVGPDGSLYVADTVKGRVWRILHAGPAPAPSPGKPSASLASSAEDAADKGALLYRQACMVCHMPDGSGVPGLQPSLLDSEVVAGEPRTLIQVVLRGPNEVLPPDREKNANQMPGFPDYTDEDVAALLSYVRRTFGPRTAGAITPAQVAASRKAPARGGPTGAAGRR
jgi:glucose/arabinose dehydrogenase